MRSSRSADAAEGRRFAACLAPWHELECTSSLRETGFAGGSQAPRTKNGQRMRGDEPDRFMFRAGRVGTPDAIPRCTDRTARLIICSATTAAGVRRGAGDGKRSRAAIRIASAHQRADQPACCMCDHHDAVTSAQGRGRAGHPKLHSADGLRDTPAATPESPPMSGTCPCRLLGNLNHFHRPAPRPPRRLRLCPGPASAVPATM